MGAFHVLQSCAKAMAKQGGSGYAIVQTGSVAGLRGTPTMSAYVSSKVRGKERGLRGLRDVERREGF